MAKLNARGRTAVAEIVREYSAEELQARHDRYQASYKPDYVPGTDKALCTWERVTRRLMSDGRILEKRDVRFQPDWLDKNGRRHSYGWKVSAKLKTGKTAEDWITSYTKPRPDGSASPWTASRSGFMPARVISKARIMRAVRSGESIGICTACGAERSGVEPDANSYPCEACGAMAVSGAENLLLEIA